MFTVIWKIPVLDELANYYALLNRGGQDELAKRIDALNRRLSNDPLAEGVSRSGRTRLTFVDSLAISFQIDSNEGVVRVVKLTQAGKRTD
jgi:hypothetical protein